MCGGTGNLAIDYLSRSRSTTRFPLALVNMQLWYRLFSAKVWLHLAWRPRGENQLADDLTNGDFGSFSIKRRVPVTWQDIDVGLLEEMLEAQRELEEALVEARQAGAGPKQKMSKRAKLESKTKWEGGSAARP